MQVYGITDEQAIAALENVNAAHRYAGNLTLAEGIDRKSGNCIRIRLAAVDGRRYGARTSASGRHGPYASWEAYRDYLRELFTFNPDARVVTAMARYNGSEGFEATYPGTAHTNVGSQVYPVTMPELSVALEGDHH